MTEPLMPDVEQMLVVWLSEGFPGVDVRTNLYVGFEEHLPLVQVTRLGGGMSYTGFVIEPRVDFSVHDATRDGASQLCHEVESQLIWKLKGTQVLNGLFAKVFEESGPHFRPDVNPHAWRFGMTWQFAVRPVY